ncbi:hypothetical protein D3C76_1336390 [compost metagenome]
MHLRLYSLVLVAQQSNVRDTFSQHGQAIQPHPKCQASMTQWIYLQSLQQGLGNSTALQNLHRGAVI